MSEVTLTVTDHAGQTRQVVAAHGDVLMHVLRDNIDDNVGICGGSISCGTCMVTLNPEWFETAAGASEDERELLEAFNAPDRARLGCQLVLDDAADGMQVTLVFEE